MFIWNLFENIALYLLDDQHLFWSNLVFLISGRHQCIYLSELVIKLFIYEKVLIFDYWYFTTPVDDQPFFCVIVDISRIFLGLLSRDCGNMTTNSTSHPHETTSQWLIPQVTIYLVIQSLRTNSLTNLLTRIISINICGILQSHVLRVVGEQNMSLKPLLWLLNTKIKNHHTRWLFQHHLSSFTVNISITSHVTTSTRPL